MSSTQSGFLGNGYAYDPLSEQNGPWKEYLSNIAGNIGGYVGGAGGILGIVAGGAAGYTAGKEVGLAIDNANTVVNNVQTFAAEISDWRSWASAFRMHGTWAP
tara:strand:- start:409 stop:717 length:309 start_codon:yes stop_codon:yes gene_type:complete